MSDDCSVLEIPGHTEVGEVSDLDVRWREVEEGGGLTLLELLERGVWREVGRVWMWTSPELMKRPWRAAPLGGVSRDYRTITLAKGRLAGRVGLADARIKLRRWSGV